MPAKLAVIALSMILMGWVLAAQPARANADIVAQILKEAAGARQVETQLMESFSKPNPDAKAVTERVQQASKNITAIRKLLDELDTRYDTLNESQRSIVRESWTIAELLGTYVENQNDALPSLKDESLREEARVNAQCAVRRATMLDETLRALTRK